MLVLRRETLSRSRSASNPISTMHATKVTDVGYWHKPLSPSGFDLHMCFRAALRDITESSRAMGHNGPAGLDEASNWLRSCWSSGGTQLLGV